jgi:hypothetical protein
MTEHAALIRPGLTLADLIDSVGGRVACLAMSKGSNAKLTIILFPPGQDRPVYVAKVPLTDIGARRVAREAALLGDLELRGVGPISETIPHIVTMVEHLGRPVLVTNALPGRNMFAEYDSWRHTGRPVTVASDFAAARLWLSALHRDTARGPADLASMLDGAPAAIASRFGADPATAADLRYVSDLRGRLAGHQIVRSVVHGDFWPGNILIDGGQVRGVIDWADSRPEGPAVLDLVRFVMTYSLYLDRHTRPGRRVRGHFGLRADRWGAGIEYALKGSGWYPGLARRFLAEGLEQLGAPGASGRDVLMAGLVTTAADADHPGFAREHLLLFRRLRIGER